MDCVITARGKSKLKQPAYRSNEFQFIQRGVCKFIFPVNSRGGQCFVTAEVRHLMQRHATFKEFTLLVTFSSLSQQRNRHCLSYVVYREREVNLMMEKEIKAGGESSWWQGDYKPNRTRTVTVISESMNKEEGKEVCLSEHQFS